MSFGESLTPSWQIWSVSCNLKICLSRCTCAER
jgi:hypothetical protein